MRKIGYDVTTKRQKEAWAKSSATHTVQGSTWRRALQVVPDVAPVGCMVVTATRVPAKRVTLLNDRHR